MDRVFHYAPSGGGDVSPLHRALTGTFRLRAGDYGVFFNLDGGTMRIAAVLHRSRAYR